MVRRIIDARARTSPDAAHLPGATAELERIAASCEDRIRPVDLQLSEMWRGEGIARHDPATGPRIRSHRRSPCTMPLDLVDSLLAAVPTTLIPDDRGTPFRVPAPPLIIALSTMVMASWRTPWGHLVWRGCGTWPARLSRTCPTVHPGSACRKCDGRDAPLTVRLRSSPCGRPRGAAR